MPKVATVYLWSNGMVMAFDEDGQQMPELQGRFAEVRAKVLEAAIPQTMFFGGQWNEKSWLLTREEFEAIKVCVRCNKPVPKSSVFLTICDDCNKEDDLIWACFTCWTEFEGIEHRCSVCNEPVCEQCEEARHLCVTRIN